MSVNVLVVDDSDIIRRMVLKTLGLSRIPLGLTYQASNGREALEILEDEWIDLVITDLNMPVMTGVEFLGELRARPGIERTPVIVVSTDGSQASLAALEQHSVVTFVRKPFTPEEIRDAVVSLVEIIDPDDHSQALAEIAVDTLERFALMYAEPSGDVSALCAEDEVLHCTMRFSGPCTGVLSLAAPLGLCRTIAENALGVEGGVDVNAAADTLGELANMIAGAFNTNHDSGVRTRLTPPEVRRAEHATWARMAADPGTLALLVEERPLLVSMAVRFER